MNFQSAQYECRLEVIALIEPYISEILGTFAYGIYTRKQRISR